MKKVKITAVIEQTENNFSAYIEEVGGIYATGKTLTEVKNSLLEAIDVFIETCEEYGYEIPDILTRNYLKYLIYHKKEFVIYEIN